jgi:hypothetical protein
LIHLSAGEDVADAARWGDVPSMHRVPEDVLARAIRERDAAGVQRGVSRGA